MNLFLFQENKKYKIVYFSEGRNTTEIIRKRDKMFIPFRLQKMWCGGTTYTFFII